MRVGIYAGESEAPALAAYAGAKALGFSVCFRNHQHWHGEIDDFDLVVVNGLWHAGSKVAKAYIAAFRPVIITDLGYLGVSGPPSRTAISPLAGTRSAGWAKGPCW